MHIGTGVYEGKEIKDGGAVLSPRALTVKEEIFAIIGIRTQDANVLDINDPNGLFGIESLTRGAKCSCFVNAKKAESNIITENLGIIGLEKGNKIHTLELGEFLKEQRCECAEYDLIFFKIDDEEDTKYIETLLEKQSHEGATVITYPNRSGFGLLDHYDGSEIVESREFDDKRVDVFLKKR